MNKSHDATTPTATNTSAFSSASYETPRSAPLTSSSVPTRSGASPEAKSLSGSYAEARDNENTIEEVQQSFRNYIVVLNEKSGSADIPGLKSFFEERAVALDKSVQFVELAKDTDLDKELNRYPDADVYVAAGGDGTLAAVAEYARRHNKVFAAIPCGTANVFAKEHFIPANAREAAELALSGTRVAPVDVLDVGGKTYLCHVSIGTYSWITTETNPEAKRRYGRVAYIFNALKLMLKEKMWTFEIEVDGRKLKRRASTIMVTNAGSMGATTMRWGENITADDGIAEICVFKARTLSHYVALLFSFIFRRPHKHLKEYFQVHEKATIKGLSKNLPVRADGEKIASGGFTFHIIKHGLRVILPPKQAVAV